jgi:hypothetical protein
MECELVSLFRQFTESQKKVFVKLMSELPFDRSAAAEECAAKMSDMIDCCKREHCEV